MADQDSPLPEEDSDSGANESQWQIPFDADANIGWSESATKKESATSKVNPPATRIGLKTRVAILSVMTIYRQRCQNSHSKQCAGVSSKSACDE